MIARFLSATVCLFASLAHGADPTPVASLSGTTLDGQRYDLASRRGRVVMVVTWRSDCAVCLDKMPELRTNAQGWKAAPFDLVLINLDALPTDAQGYERVRRLMAPGEQSVFSFWHGHAVLPPAWRHADRLPHTLIVGRDGAISATYQGRVPASAWNMVADLLP